MRARYGAYFFAVALCAQPTLTDQQRLEKIRDTAVTTLFAQPNYTCLETVIRQHEVNGVLQVEDKLKLEVAIVNGKELFGWPGAASFEDLDVMSVIRGGLFDTGNFGIYPRMLFYGEAARFTYQGESAVNNRPAIRHNFVVPKEASGFHVQRKDIDVTVGFHGAIYTDPTSSELMRLVAVAEGLPGELGLTEATDSVDYGRVSLGGGNFLLPLSSESIATGAKTLDRSNVQFTKCARFSGESRIILDADEEGAQTTSTIHREVTLPKDATVQLAIGEISLETGAVGDSVKATLISDIKRGKEILVPKGATAIGRITKLSRYPSQYRLGVKFQQLTWPGGSARLNAKLASVKAGKAELDPSGDLVVSRTTTTLTGLSLVWKVLP
ncbi:MAG: hypothetical protein ABI824_16315 [Acidobacteriota bacterium]